jgi:hypothetical protein
MRQSRSSLFEPMLTPENKLWRAVLEQAYTDAELWADCDDNGDGPAERIQARGYLRGDGAQATANLALVCDFAAIPADRVTGWARKHYPQSQSLRTKHAKSRRSLRYQQHAMARNSHTPRPPGVSAGLVVP